MQQVVFKNVQGINVPCQPWPQTFYVSRLLYEIDAIEVRPLTVTGLVKGLGKNFITMNWWRALSILRRAGLLDTPEGARLSLHDWRWDFWRVRRMLRSRSGQMESPCGTSVL